MINQYKTIPTKVEIIHQEISGESLESFSISSFSGYAGNCKNDQPFYKELSCPSITSFIAHSGTSAQSSSGRQNHGIQSTELAIKHPCMFQVKRDTNYYPYSMNPLNYFGFITGYDYKKYLLKTDSDLNICNITGPENHDIFPNGFEIYSYDNRHSWYMHYQQHISFSFCISVLFETDKAFIKIGHNYQPIINNYYLIGRYPGPYHNWQYSFNNHYVEVPISDFKDGLECVIERPGYVASLGSSVGYYLSTFLPASIPKLTLTKDFNLLTTLRFSV